jgi:predicted transcriptional regulator
MEVHFSPVLETKLNEAAAESGSDADRYVQQLVESYVDHDAWFRRKVHRGLEELDRGEYLTHEEVGERLKRMFPA